MFPFFMTGAEVGDTIFLNKFNKVVTKDSAEYYRIALETDSGYSVHDYYMNDVLEMSGNYSLSDHSKKNGTFIYYHDNKQVSYTGLFINNKESGKHTRFFNDGRVFTDAYYIDGKKDGVFLKYRTDGKLRRKENYINGKLIDGFCYGVNGNDTTFFPEEQMPVFPGGENALMSYLSTHIKYPKKARKKEITGRVYVTFVVDKSGYVKDARILRSPDPIFDEPSLELVRSLPQWTPGMQEGEPVNVQYNLPLRFNLR